MGGGDGPLFLVPSLWSHGLLIVDYIHFRYNGYLLGFLLLFPLSLLEEGKDLAGGLILPVPFCFFHHFFVHLLRHHCRRGPWEASRRFLTMGIAVSTVSPRRSVHSCSMSRGYACRLGFTFWTANCHLYGPWICGLFNSDYKTLYY
nr:PREDICTED: probable dolichyl pyrophosphate Glc1Man9GlcNAc2 alpha-1,3-glucosyltransferase isoform X5 [Musa acuminata subsp. malaccensis]